MPSPQPFVHSTISVTVVSGAKGKTTWVVVREVDHTDPEPLERMRWHRFDEVVAGGHAISFIGGAIKPFIVNALKKAGLRIP